jgi:hypothetical protein
MNFEDRVLQTVHFKTPLLASLFREIPVAAGISVPGEWSNLEVESQKTSQLPSEQSTESNQNKYRGKADARNRDRKY